MGKVKITELNYLLGILFGIFVYLIIPHEYTRLDFIPIVFTCGVNVLYILIKRKKPNISIIICSIMVVYIILIDYLFGYSQNYAIRAWLTLLMISLISYNGIKHLSSAKESIIWIIVLALLLFRTYTSPRMADGSPIFPTIFVDRIETELCIVLFMFYAVKNKKISGVIFTLAYYFMLSSSRGTLLILVMFFAIRYSKGFMKRIYSKYLSFFKRKWLIVSLTVIAVTVYIVFCYYWVNSIAVTNVLQHGAGLNDTSNFSRFASTVYVFEEIIGKYNLLFFGFGSDLKTVMGLDGAVKKLYMGYTLVQSHNSIINLMLRLGYIPGIMYLSVIIGLIKKNAKFENAEYIFSYIVYSFIIVMIAKQGLDAFWIYIMMIPEISKKSFGGKIRLKKQSRMYVNNAVSEKPKCYESVECEK